MGYRVAVEREWEVLPDQERVSVIFTELTLIGISAYWPDLADEFRVDLFTKRNDRRAVDELRYSVQGNAQYIRDLNPKFPKSKKLFGIAQQLAYKSDEEVVSKLEEIRR